MDIETSEKYKRFRNTGIVLLLLGIIASFFTTLISLALMLTSVGFLMYSSHLHREARRYKWAIENPSTERELYLSKVEKKIVKRATSAATWYESKRDFKLDGLSVDLLMKGDTGMRGMGFVISRFLERVVPSYAVAIFIFSREKLIPLQMIKQVFKAVLTYVEREKLRWCCVFVAGSDGFSSQCNQYVENLLDKRVGFILVNLKKRTIHKNPVFISKSFAKYAKIK